MTKEPDVPAGAPLTLNTAAMGLAAADLLDRIRPGGPTTREGMLALVGLDDDAVADALTMLCAMTGTAPEVVDGLTTEGGIAGALLWEGAAVALALGLLLGVQVGQLDAVPTGRQAGRERSAPLRRRPRRGPGRAR